MYGALGRKNGQTLRRFNISRYWVEI